MSKAPVMDQTGRAIMVAGHICLDLTPKFPHTAGSSLLPGTLTRVEDLQRSVGGVVANTGLALHQLGVETRMLSRISDDPTGDEILRVLSDISPSLAQDMVRVSGESTSYSIVVSPPGVDRLFLHCPGCNDHFHASDVTLSSDTSTRLLHFGYPPIMRTIYQQAGCELITLFQKAHKAGMATSLDMCSVDPNSEAGKVDWKRWLKNVLPHADLFVPSLDELLFMLGEEDAVATIELLERVTDQLLDYGVPVVMLKLGEYGLYLRTTQDKKILERISDGLLGHVDQWVNRSLYTSCFNVDVVSTNGAGDYTIAGFLAAIVAGQQPAQALQSAVGCGASHVANPANLPPWEDIQSRINQGWQHLSNTIDTSAMHQLTPTPGNSEIPGPRGLWASPNDQKI